jgi:hypothetical protein
MMEAGLSGAAMDAFKHNYDQLIAGVTGLVSAIAYLCFSEREVNLFDG